MAESRDWEYRENETVVLTLVGNFRPLRPPCSARSSPSAHKFARGNITPGGEFLLFKAPRRWRCPSFHRYVGRFLLFGARAGIRSLAFQMPRMRIAQGASVKLKLGGHNYGSQEAKERQKTLRREDARYRPNSEKQGCVDRLRFCRRSYGRRARGSSSQGCWRGHPTRSLGSI